MKLLTLLAATLFALPLGSATLAAAATPGVSSPAPIILAQDGGMDMDVDINVTIGESGGAGDWYAQPMWIAIFVLGGIVVLILLVLAMRGGGKETTVVK